MQKNAVLETIAPHNTILCLSHVDPDGDAVGSLLGMFWLLKALGKSPVASLQDQVPPELRWLPGVNQIVSTAATRRPYDLIIALDASSADRMGSVFHPSIHGSLPLLVIDHHITNTQFGSFNWVDPQCAATCQMVLDLVLAAGLPLTRDVADCLLTGIVTDTLCFRTSNTTQSVLEAAIRLLNTGTNLNEITQRTLDLRPFSALKLAGVAMANAQLVGGVLWVRIKRKDAQAIGADPGEANLNSILSRTVEADITAVFTEKYSREGKPMVDCSFRGKPGFNVGGVALALGGGGHPAAAGCTMPGLLDDVVEQVIPILQATRQQTLDTNRQLV